MTFEIDKAFVESATKCEKNLVCLKSADHVYCPVSCCVMHTVHYVECLHDEPCAYKETLEGSPICTCPVRREIFNRYGK